MLKKRFFMIITLSLVLFGCVQENIKEKHSYSLSNDGYLVVDGEKTSVKVNGIDGINGADGIDGKDGINGEDGKDGIDGFTPYIGEDGNWWINDQNTGQQATLTPLNISDSYTVIPANSQISFPVVFTREFSATIETLKIQVKYSNFEEFLNLETIHGTMYEMYGYQRFTIKAEIKGKVLNANPGNIIVVLLSFGNEPVALFGDISSNGSFNINDEILTSSISSDYIISNIFLVEP